MKEGRKYDLGDRDPAAGTRRDPSQGDNWLLPARRGRPAGAESERHFHDLLSSRSTAPPARGFVECQPGLIPFRSLLFEQSFQPADPFYDRAAVDCYASRLRAVETTGRGRCGVRRPATVNQAVDATETFKAAAIKGRDEQFQAVRADRGIRWGFVQHKLAIARDVRPRRTGAV